VELQSPLVVENASVSSKCKDEARSLRNGALVTVAAFVDFEKSFTLSRLIFLFSAYSGFVPDINKSDAIFEVNSKASEDFVLEKPAAQAENTEYFQ
jgi:hypothetical protein